MSIRNRLGALLVLSCVAAPAAAAEHAPRDPNDSPTSMLVHDLWRIVSDVSTLARQQRQGQQPSATPQAIAPAQDGTPAVDLSDLSKPSDIESRLRSALRTTDGVMRVTVEGGTARQGNFIIGTGQEMRGHLLVVRGDADVYGQLQGNLVTVDGNVVVHEGGLVAGDILTLGGQVRADKGEISGEARELRTTSVLTPVATIPTPAKAGAVVTMLQRGAGILGVFLTLFALGFGLVMFGRPNLEVVSDTVSHSFGRSFVTGLLGQILLLPTFGMLVVGLVLSVAGILLLPFAVAVYALLVVVGVVGGYLAVAHAMGETYVRRRMALGAVMGSPNSYRYLMIGLGAVAVFWLAWAIFGWVPVAGNLIRAVAVLVTWLLGTAGFGAALLSRAGIRENFAGRLLPPEALTDEYLWATPQFGVQAARRPGSRTPTRGL
ncbi:MAG TPA: polymer-forming cytoskeletal protein [Gemmatimonadales bacterium]|jgi:hypothetical protein